MVAAHHDAELRAERAALEEDIARLQSRLVVARRRADRAEARGPDPRGFGVGLLVAAIVIAAGGAAMFLAFMDMMRHLD